MCFNEFFNSPEMQLPLTRKDANFLRYIVKLFDSYRACISGYEPAIKDSGMQLSENIIAVIMAYLKGFPNRAYDLLNNAITEEIKQFLRQSYEIKEGTSDSIRLYRMRIGRDNVINREDIFHVPYEKRHLISTQRYSIPGLPCLYLSGSLYTCWVELGKPSFEDISVAAFYVDHFDNVKFLRLDANPKWVAAYKRDPIFRGNYIKIWPLIAACSIKSYHPSANFKPEYIVPQLLLQWIAQSKDQDFDGIKFFSTHIDNLTEDPHWCCNCVIPSAGNREEKFCDKLNRKFILTEPYYWRLLSTTNFVTERVIQMGLIRMELIPGKPEDYQFTEFGEVQMNLDSLLEDVREMHKENRNHGKVMPVIEEL